MCQVLDGIKTGVGEREASGVVDEWGGGVPYSVAPANGPIDDDDEDEDDLFFDDEDEDEDDLDDDEFDDDFDDDDEDDFEEDDED